MLTLRPNVFTHAPTHLQLLAFLPCYYHASFSMPATFNPKANRQCHVRSNFMLTFALSLHTRNVMRAFFCAHVLVLSYNCCKTRLGIMQSTVSTALTRQVAASAAEASENAPFDSSTLLDGDLHFKKTQADSCEYHHGRVHNVRGTAVNPNPNDDS